MKKLLFLSALFTLIFASCDEGTNPDTGSIEINFSATYGGQPLATDGTVYPFNDMELQFERIKFFIGEIELVGIDGSITPISDVEIFDLAGKTAETAVDGESVILNNIDAGEYQAVNFYVGLSERLNNLRPSEVPAKSAQNDGTYWSDWGSFIFSSIAGKEDLNQDGTLEHNIVYHIGGNDAIRQKSFPGTVFLEGGELTTLNFEIDLRDMFMGDGVPFDVVNYNQVHQKSEIMLDLADRMQASIQRK